MIFKKHETNHEEAVIISGKFLSENEHGSDSERLAIHKLETSIEDSLLEDDELDGHEIGDGKFYIYIYGIDADKIYKIIQPLLSHLPFHDITVTVRYGPADDPKAEEKIFPVT